jgi:hypothetical protein
LRKHSTGETFASGQLLDEAGKVRAELTFVPPKTSVWQALKAVSDKAEGR